MSDGPISVHIDGAARGNPGPAAIAYVIATPAGPIEHAETLGNATNNTAEYTALVRVLHRAAELGLRRLVIHSDSELMVKQMAGEYRVKNADLKELYDQAQELLPRFANVELRHVRREANKRADELCNLVLDGEYTPGAAPAKAKPKEKAAKPKKSGSDSTVRDDAVACLSAAAKAWAAGGEAAVSPAAVWEQLWSVLEEGGVLKRAKSKSED